MQQAIDTLDVDFYDYHPEPADFYAEVIAGLKASPKRIPPKFFYDETGSRLFDKICELPEYYPTRTEKRILRENKMAIARELGEECILIEPGSGSSDKVRLLLDAVQPSTYMPMDISREHLLDASIRISQDFPWLDVKAACIDFTTEIELPKCADDAHKVVFFPGSSIGNFEPGDAVVFLKDIASIIGKGGGLLIGVDLKKEPAILHNAYNDSQQITAAFNTNVLNRINRELDADFDVTAFDHYAFYNTVRGRIEMHLISKRDQVVQVGEMTVQLQQGETIHTENSYKYTIDDFARLAEKAGLDQQVVWTDEDDLFSVQYLQARSE